MLWKIKGTLWESMCTPWKSKDFLFEDVYSMGEKWILNKSVRALYLSECVLFGRVRILYWRVTVLYGREKGNP